MKAFLTSNYLICHFDMTIMKRITLMVVSLTIGLKVSSKSNPRICVKPLATNWALNQSTLPSSLYLVLKTHLDLTMFLFSSLGTRTHVWLECKASIWSYIAATQLEYFKVDFNVSGSRIYWVFIVVRTISCFSSGLSLSFFLVTIWWILLSKFVSLFDIMTGLIMVMFSSFELFTCATMVSIFFFYILKNR